MSARQMRRLIGPDKLELATESSDEEAPQTTKPGAGNLFDLLGGNDEEDHEEEAPTPSNDDGDSTTSANQSDISSSHTELASNASYNSKKKQNKKKNGKRRNDKANAPNDDDDLDALLSSIPSQVIEVEIDPSSGLNARLREILKVNVGLLDPDAEMTRLFGADVVPNRAAGNQARPGFGGFGARGERGGRGQPGITVRKKSLLVKPRPNWPPVGGKGDGLDMILVETKQGINYFKFTWDAGYKRAQKQFHACVETGDPNNLAALLHTYPYHVDTLLQLHDAFQMTDDKDASMDLLERLLYRFEAGWHLKFDPFAASAASSLRLLYKEPENRTFMLGILSYIQEIGRKGCSQTALEWSKMLLAFDLSDPLGVLLLIDHFALRRREHLWLLRFYHSPLFEEHDLSMLPNFVYSIALAAFYHKKNLAEDQASSSSSPAKPQSRPTDGDNDYSDVNPTELLHNAMMMHPSLFMGLVARLATGSIRSGGKNVLELPHFANAASTVLPLVNVLHQLYIERNHAMWKDPVCVQWLKDAAASFYVKMTSSSTTSEEMQGRIDSYAILAQELTTNPQRLHRHIMLSEYNSVIRMLPSEVLREGFHIYGPGEIDGLHEGPDQRAAGPQQLPGAAGNIQRILDYLVPFQTDPQQLQNLLNLIGYRVDNGPQGDADQAEGSDDE